jgi:hypothetical protein
MDRRPQPPMILHILCLSLRFPSLFSVLYHNKPNVVVMVLTYFNDSQHQAMKDADTIYSLNVFCIIKETCITIMKELHRWFVWYSDVAHGPKMSNSSNYL